MIGVLYVCLTSYLMMNMHLVAKVVVQQKGLQRGLESEMLRESGVGLLQGPPSGEGGEAMVGHVRAGKRTSVRRGCSVNVQVMAALREGFRTSGAGETS